MSGGGAETVIFKEGQSAIGKEGWQLVLESYQIQNEITLQCSNYNNPIYRKEYTGFKISIGDRESYKSPILETSEFSLPKMDGMEAHALLASAINFNFMKRNTGDGDDSDGGNSEFYNTLADKLPI